MKLRWVFRAAVILAVLLLVMGIASMVYLVSAKYQANNYLTELASVFNAATMVNAEETHTEEDSSVIVSYDGRRYLLSPDNYKAVMSYLKRQAAMPLYAPMDKSTALTITVCGDARFWVCPDRSGEGINVRMETPREKLTMHCSGGDVWQSLVTLCTKGSSNYRNTSLD